MNAPHVLSVNILRVLPVKTFECPWSLSIPQSFQFSWNFALRTLFASRNRQYPRANTWPYFQSKQSLLFIYYHFTFIFTTIIGVTIMHVLGSLNHQTGLLVGAGKHIFPTEQVAPQDLKPFKGRNKHCHNIETRGIKDSLHQNTTTNSASALCIRRPSCLIIICRQIQCICYQ